MNLSKQHLFLAVTLYLILLTIYFQYAHKLLFSNSVRSYTKNQVYSDKMINDTEGSNSLNLITFKPQTTNTVSKPINIAMVAEGSVYVRKALTVIKSTVLFTDSRINFYIFSLDGSSGRLVTSEINLWPKAITRKFTVISHILNCTKWNSHFEKINRFEKFSPKVCMFLTLHEDLINLTKVIVLDADVLVLSDINNLWEKFSYFNESHTMGMALAGTRYVNNNRFPVYDKYGVNSGVVLVDLITSRLQKYSQNLTNNINTRYKMLYIHGDQDLSNLYFAEYPQFMFNLPCDWNFRKSFDNCSKHKLEELQCPEAWKYGIKILHMTGFTTLFTQGMYSILYKAIQNTELLYPVKTNWVRVVQQFVSLRKRKCGEDDGKFLLGSFYKSLNNVYLTSNYISISLIKHRFTNLTTFFQTDSNLF